MLSGIKTGKRKRKAAAQVPDPGPDGATLARRATSTTRCISASSNQSVAEQLRQSLASGVVSEHSTSGDLPHEVLERMGRIKEAVKPSSDDAVTVVEVPATTSRAERLLADESEKSSSFAGKMSIDEELARNIVRLGKKRNQKMKSNIDSDEEEQRLLSMAMPSEPKESKKQAADEKAKRRAISHELALNDKQDRIVSQCWWWMESSQFSKHRLLSLGNHVSLVLAPPNLSLTPGRHFYIVPIKHAESLAGCEEEVWDEITRFQTSLRNLFDKEYKQGVLFSETVLPTNNFWQTKMEVIPVKRKIWLDSELYFKSTLTEQADEFGTHNKLLSTKVKGLRRTVPKNFPYFFIEWDAPNQGYAQIIESSNFPPDFAADTIAGMAGLDPLRFLRKKKFTTEQEKAYILEFLEKWKRYDWTDQLDAEI